MNHVFRIATAGPACHDLTRKAAEWLMAIDAGRGLLTLMVRHTSCSLLIQENADPDVRIDFETAMNHAVPEVTDPFSQYASEIATRSPIIHSTMRTMPSPTLPSLLQPKTLDRYLRE